MWPLREFYTIRDAFVKLKRQEFIFPCEKDPKSSKQTFVVGTHIDFLAEYETTKEPRYHEFIFSDRIIKPYLDLELCEGNKEQFETEVKRILSLLTDYGEYVSFTSSREGKHSLHIIFQYQSTLADVKARIAQIKSPIIDMQVYRSGTFRMAYSRSFRSFPHVLKYYNLETGEIDDKYNREYFKKSLLHYFEFHYEQPRRIVNMGPQIHRATQTYDAIIYAWVQSQGWRVANYKEEENVIKVLMKDVNCPRIKRPHKSNNFYLRIDLDTPDFPSTFGCLDCECTSVKFSGRKFSTILKEKQMKDQILTLLNLQNKP